MEKKMPKSAVKTPSFDVYKSIKDEIIEISELRFENILTKKLNAFRQDFKRELMEELNPRFDAIDSKFDAIDSKFDMIKWSIWSLPVVMSVIMALFAVLVKFVFKL
jgi:hypothetical protein